jgi:hypothetical protein
VIVVMWVRSTQKSSGFETLRISGANHDGNAPPCGPLARMTKLPKKKTKAASKRWKAPNRRVAARARESTPPLSVPKILAQEPSTKLSLALWPLEVMKWWMPRATRSGTNLAGTRRGLAAAPFASASMGGAQVLTQTQGSSAGSALLR